MMSSEFKIFRYFVLNQEDRDFKLDMHPVASKAEGKKGQKEEQLLQFHAILDLGELPQFFFSIIKVDFPIYGFIQ